KKFTWKIVDPDSDPGQARRYGIESYGTIVLETKARSEKVLDPEEEKLTNGLLKVTREGKRIVYVVQGHGEHELGSSERAGFSEAKGALEKSNYEVKSLALALKAAIPDDAAVVVIAGPRTDLFAPEVDALSTGAHGDPGQPPAHRDQRAAAREDTPRIVGGDGPAGARAGDGQAGSPGSQGAAVRGRGRDQGQGADRRVRHLEPRQQPVPQRAGQPRLLPQHGELARRGGGPDHGAAEGHEADADL